MTESAQQESKPSGAGVKLFSILMVLAVLGTLAFGLMKSCSMAGQAAGS